MKCVTMDTVKLKVLGPSMYAIDVESIPPHNRNNREVHLDYLKHLKESVGTFREIVEEARIEKPLDNVLEYACLYTKRSQELLEYVIGTYLKELSKSDKKWKPTERKFTFREQCPLTRFTKYKVVPLQQPKHEKAISTGIPTIAESQTIDASVTYNTVVQIVLWYLDSGCTKHMTGNRSQLRNFMKKFIGTVRFGNDHFGAIMGYGHYVIGDSVIFRVYYVEGLGDNLFFVGQFCDSDLEVAFRKHSCYVRDVDGVELLKGNRGSNLYTITVEDMMKSPPICLLSKASKNKSWLWHHQQNHLNFGTINDLARKDLNGIVERRNHTFVEATQKILIFSKALMLLFAKAVATAYDSEDLVKLQATTYIGIFVRYAPNRKEYFEPSSVERLVPPAPAAQVPVYSAATHSSTTSYQDAPSTSHSPPYSKVQALILHQGVEVRPTIKDNPFAHANNDPFVNVFALEPSSDESSSRDVSSAEFN
ncbi:hypothetical protein Tco_1393037 [Tanacetum coccineum]